MFEFLETNENENHNLPKPPGCGKSRKDYSNQCHIPKDRTKTTLHCKELEH